MKRKVFQGSLILVVIVMFSSFAWSKVEKPRRWWGQPFQKIWHAILDLQEQIDDIQLTPGPQGPPGEQGPEGLQGKPGDFDKQIRIPIQCYGGSLGTDEYTEGPYIIYKFNVSDYPNVHSITFAAPLESRDGDAYVMLDLINITDGEIISSSLIMTNSTSYTWVESENFIDELPYKYINIGYRVRTDTPGSLVSSQPGFLLLQRN